MRLREVFENTGQWITHRQLAEIVYMRTGNKQLARDFDAMEDEYVSQDDMQMTGLGGFDVDGFEFDRERVNKFLGDHNTGVKVLRMKQDDAYNSLYQIMQMARINAGVKEADVIDFDKATDPANTPIDRVNKLLQRIGISDYGVIINKPFDSKTYELLIDTYMNKVFSSPMENKILDYVIKIYQKRGEQAKQLPPTTEGTRCWKGYKKKGMKTMFGKRVPNCVKNEDYAFLSRNVMEVHPLEKERRKKIDMIKRGQDAGIPSHIPADAMTQALKRPKYTKEYLSKIIAHPDTTVKDLKRIESSLYQRPPSIDYDSGEVNTWPEDQELIDMVRAEVKRRGGEKIVKWTKHDDQGDFSMDIDDYSYRDQVGGQKTSSRPDLEHPLATDMPDGMGIDIGSLFQQGQSPDEIADQLADEYGIGKSRAIKMVDQWQDSQYNRNYKNLYAKPFDKPIIKPERKITKRMKMPSVMAQPFHQLLKSFVDDGYSDEDIIELVMTDNKLKRTVKQDQLPTKLKAIRSMK